MNAADVIAARLHAAGVRSAFGIPGGEVLTLMIGNEIRVVEVTSLPDRRASPALAKTFYRDLADKGDT